MTKGLEWEKRNQRVKPPRSIKDEREWRDKAGYQLSILPLIRFRIPEVRDPGIGRDVAFLMPACFNCLR